MAGTKIVYVIYIATTQINYGKRSSMGEFTRKWNVAEDDVPLERFSRVTS